MNILALDVSLTASGWAQSDRSYGVLHPPKGRDRGMPRLAWIRDMVRDLASDTDVVAIEGYAFGAKGAAVINLGELGGVVRLMLYESRARVVEIPPACVKLFATGKGNAPKDEVLAAAIRKLGYAGHDHNVADALFLLAMATAVYEHATLTDYQRRAVEKIVWPKIAPAVAA